MRPAQLPTQIPAVLERLERWLAGRRPRYLSGLNPPATAAQLKELAARLGRPVPEELQALLSWHDGQGEGFVGAFEEHWLLMGCQDIADAKKPLDADAAQTGWRSEWIPFLDDDAGNYLCLDTAAANRPVRAFYPGKAEHPVLAPSLAAWLADFVTQVEQGTYVEEPERGAFLRTSS